VRRKKVGGLTTLCLKPFMTATGANARQAVRRSGGEGKGPRWECPRGVGEDVAAQRDQCSAARNCAKTMSQEKKRWAQIGMGDGRVP
jgi:hypothetical protein